ncbi:MAG: hypothetical protein H8D23_23560 [Candidatus Brocadiales bacterium]|nr:hypothetical protein [Candidatus Brocadiales bacterium]
MPRTKTTQPKHSREKNQRSLDFPFIWRILPQWNQPQWFKADAWRAIVKKQPVATICKETLISNILALDWKLEPRDSEQRDELKEEIEYYTDLFEHDGKYGYEERTEWVLTDYLDLPFGGCAELGYRNDDPEDRLLWIELLDGGTLFPTRNKDWPIGQALKINTELKTIYFPSHTVSRIYMSPRTEMEREGWGVAPPEKIYLALELLTRGDKYYANLLLDTPEAGLLDLMDMERESAEEWIKSFKELVTGIDPFKIPVLYEHTSEAKFIPFGKPPTDLMFDRITLKYASITCAGYGMSLSDIGMQASSSGGETLAGSIRQERRTRRTGHAKSKKAIMRFYNKMLPKSLYFKFIDLDEEVAVAKGRARLAHATAASQYISSGVFGPDEMRQQALADGLIDISIPETMPEDERNKIVSNQSNERPGLLGRPIAPSQGGQGEVLASEVERQLSKLTQVDDVHLKRLIRSSIQPISIEVGKSLVELDDSDVLAWINWHDNVLWGEIFENVPELTLSALENSRSYLQKSLKENEWWIPDDVDGLIGDWVENFVEAYRVYNHEFLKDKFEKGEIKKLPEKSKADKRVVSKFEKSLQESNRIFWDNVGYYVINSVISGVRNGLVEYMPLEGSLDIEKFINDNMDKLVQNVRSELTNVREVLLVTYANTVSETINTILENENGDYR